MKRNLKLPPSINRLKFFAYQDIVKGINKCKCLLRIGKGYMNYSVNVTILEKCKVHTKYPWLGAFVDEDTLVRLKKKSDEI